jgi:hypothetical protein
MTAAVLDACVLYSAPLRDFFMQLTVGLVFQPKWTERIHEEWIRNVLEHHPERTPAQLERTRDLMNHHGRDWQVPDHEALIETLTLPDAEDRHVLAAAIVAGVSLIVTFNLKDFPKAVLTPHGIQARHPDDFACGLFDEEREAFLLALQTIRARLKKPPMSPEEYLEKLKDCGLKKTVEKLRPHLAEL